MSQPADPPLRILSLDGGGIRGKSSLLILESIMEKIRDAQHLDETPKPCEMFDFIGGTSTGGIIAIMLGRLGMSVDECIRAYDRVGEAAFTPKSGLRLASPKGAFSAKALEAAIKEVVKSNCVEPTCAEKRTQGQSTTSTCPHGEVQFREKTCIKTAVLAITKDNVDAPPTLFTTYDTSAAFDGCTIWQIARATSAATTFFKPIKLGRDKIDFVDAGFGHNNPCEVLIEAAQREFPDRNHLQVLSIGTGLGEVVSIKDNRFSILKALKKMATTSKTVAMRLEDRYGGSGSYHRFNVERGLEDVTLSDWQKTSNISAHTSNYLRENRRAIDGFVSIFLSTPTQAGTGTAELNGHPGRNAHHYLPLQENEHFVRRAKMLEILEKKLLQEHRREVALIGLGGAGKTQIALQFAYDIKRNKPGLSVFWISALSHESFDQSCTAIASLLGIQEDKEDPKEVFYRYMSSERAGKCLIIVDNADDGEILFGNDNDDQGFYKYLAGFQTGQILFTTRFRDVARRGYRREILEVPKMEVNEAILLLKELSVPEALIGDDKDALELLDELAYHPLAIAQAGAYLERNGISITRYLQLLRSEEQNMVNLMSREFNDDALYQKSQRAVATTWLVSFYQIQRTDAIAADVLSFLSCIEPKAIPESLLEIFQNHTELEITEALGTLSGYSFVKRQEDGRFLIMHSLVHLAVRIWLKESGQAKTTVEAALEQILDRFPDDEWENRMIWREYMPHAIKILQDISTIDLKTRHDLNYWVGRCLYAEARYPDAVARLKEAWQWSQQHRQKDDPDRLDTEYELSAAYRKNGQVKDAIKMLEHVVEVRSSISAEDSPGRLNSQHELAKAYLNNGQAKDAIEILEQVVKIRLSILTENHPDRLTSQHELAGAYVDNGQVEDAIGILERVLEIRSSILAEDHPERLASQHALAGAYLDNGQVEDAIGILEQVVEIKSSILAEDHPDRLASQHELARAYLKNGQVKDAIGIIEQVVEIRLSTLAEDHPDRLSSQHELARAYLDNGQVKDAIGILEQVVEIESSILAEDNPDRLISQEVLGAAYLENGEASRAAKLLEHVVAVHRRVSAEDHPRRLRSEELLEESYEALGGSGDSE